MNLQEILNYRNKCLICQKDMILNNKELVNLKVTIESDGLMIRHGKDKDRYTLFKFDGTFEKGEK